MPHMGVDTRNRRIQRAVVRLILDRGLGAGAPLPTETELMADLGVSRNSVREALKALQALDLVEIRHGYGTYVGRASLAPLVDGLTFRALALRDGEAGVLAEILQVREVLEEGLIRRVAGAVTEERLDALDSVLERMEGAVGEEFGELDREFGELLYASVGSALVPELLGVFREVSLRVSGELGGVALGPEVRVGRYRGVVAALRRRDVEGARKALTGGA
ncbi:FadR/GntR family transcriptional regulator [Streptomyces sp. NPDC056716]|uniref:FadR/GntR family transcriptional regulator n=1 Tax=unclassified Streptomyces TaxID=2593676 RepID=UPI00367D84B9